MMTDERRADERQAAGEWRPGQAVRVRAFGRVYAGTVVRVGRTRVRVRFTTNNGTEHERAVPASRMLSL